MNKKILINRCLNHNHLDHKILKLSQDYSWNYCKTCKLIFIKVINKKHKTFKNKLKIFDNFEKSKFSNEFLFIFNKAKNIINLKNKKWLDFGCGSGNELNYIKSQKIEYFGYEPNEKLFKKCRNKHLKVTNKIQNLKKNYDIIFTRNTFKYVENFPKTFSKLSKLLKKNGLLIWRDKYFDYMPIIKSMNDIEESMVTSTFLRKDSIKNYLNILNFKINFSRFYLDNSFLIIATKKFEKKQTHFKLNNSSLYLYKNKFLFCTISYSRNFLLCIYNFLKKIKSSFNYEK